MKKAYALIMSVAITCAAWAQSLEDVNARMEKGDMQGAKAAIDKFMENPKKAKDADGWYFKARVYNQLSHDKSLDLNTRKELKDQAYEAFKTNQTLDPKEMRLKLETYQSYLDLYFGYYDLGATFYNEKNYSAAYDAFMKAHEVKDFILAKNYTYTQAKLYPLDTALVMNIGLSANLDKKEDVGMPYYRKLADHNVSGKDYEGIYEVLVNYYSNKGDSVNLKQILTKAKKLYPSNAFIADFEMKQLSKTGDKSALFAKYEEMIAADPKNYPVLYNYSVEMFNAIYVADEKPANEKQLKDRLTKVLEMAIPLDKEIDATILMSNHLFNAAADNQTAAALITGKSADDLKKKKELNDEALKYMNAFIPYGEKIIAYLDALPSLKGSQKANRINTLTNLSEVYSVKG
ncbi:MAG: hypothetical protein EOP53_20450, partial [Sphingobacteriales bacterium]